jgi:cell division ATP-binding protein FtsE
MIVFKHVSKRYNDSQDALKGVNFHLPKGEMAFLTGHSGAGKSTLLKLITLNERATRGTVEINGQALSQLKGKEIAVHRRNIGVVYQNHRLLNDRTVFENVALPLFIMGHDRRETARRVRAALDKVNLLNKEKMYPMALSGGEQQRVGIARAMVHRPDIILADEPTGNLDPELSVEIMDLFALFHQYNTTILIATHDLDMLERYRYPILKLQQGHLQSWGLE